MTCLLGTKSTISPSELSRHLERGAVAVVPTDTVYGLAVSPRVFGVAQRVFDMKGRPDGVNLPVVIGHVSQLDELGVDVNHHAETLINLHWPGALTIVFGFRDGTERPAWLRGREEVAVRVPADPYLQSVARVGGPVLVTSANNHGEPTPDAVGPILLQLRAEPDVAVDAGRISGEPSTLVNTRGSSLAIERNGPVAVQPRHNDPIADDSR